MTDNLLVSSRVVALAALGLAFGGNALPAMAGQTTVTATISNGQDFDFLAAAGSFAVHAYSE